MTFLEPNGMSLTDGGSTFRYTRVSTSRNALYPALCALDKMKNVSQQHQIYTLARQQ